MIDFDVVTGPSPSEKPSEPSPKPVAKAPVKMAGETLPRATLLPRQDVARPIGDAKSRP
jgi:hypothetical protein